VPSGLAVASYVLHAAALLVPGIDPWQKVSPFYQALSTGPLGAGLPPSYLWLALVTLVAVIASLGLLDRRDIDTAG
jgi:ABC-2 type transport system permease protein